MKYAFELLWQTPRVWAACALDRPLELLSDHAHCELGATVSAQGLIARFPEESTLVERMTALAVEELRHFGQVHRLLRALGGKLRPVRTNEYAEALVRRAGRGRDALVDRLLVAAVIERRSLERFELLGDVATERAERGELAPEIGRLFTELAPSEAGHAALFVELARDIGRKDVTQRLQTWLETEAEVLQALPFGAWVHSGVTDIEAVHGTTV